MQPSEPARKSRQGRLWIRDAGLILLGVLSLIFRQSSPVGVEVAWSQSTGRAGPGSHGFHRRLRRQVLGPAVALLAAEDWPAYSAQAEDKVPIDLDTYKSKITRLLGEVPVYAVTDPSGSPVLEDVEQRLGRFYMDPDDASAALRRVNTGSKNLEVRKLALSDVFVPIVIFGKAEELGGQFQLAAAAPDLRAASKRLGVESLGQPGQVPLFLCPSLEVERFDNEATAGSSVDRVPAFLHEADLLTALGRANLKGEEAEIVVTTLQRVAADLARPDESAASQVLVVANLAEIGLGTWR